MERIFDALIVLAAVIFWGCAVIVMAAATYRFVHWAVTV